MFSVFAIVTGVMATLLILQYITISDNAGSYAIQLHQHYPDVEQSTLYDFVMLSDAANKWMKFVTFVATDHKSIGVGKTYKVVIGAQTYAFVTIEHQQGQYIILQNVNKNDVLNLRVEIRFSTVFCMPVQLDEAAAMQKSLDLFSFYPSNATIENYGTNASQKKGMCNKTASEEHQKRQSADLFSITGKCGSELSFKLFSLHNSLLFQNTIGVMFRYFLGLRLEHSLANLAHILLHVEG